MLAPTSNHYFVHLLLFVINVTSLLTFTTAQTSFDGSNVNSVKLPALGRTARLGSLYNSRTEELTGVSIFKSGIPPHLIVKTDVPGTNTRYGVIKSYSDKSALLDVSASLTLSFLAGLISVTGAARFLSDEKKSSSSVVGSLIYETTISEDIIEIFYDEILDYLNPALFENATETHVVIGQGYGSNTLIKFEDTNSRNEAVSTIEARMGASLDILGFGVSVDAQVGVGDTTIDTFSNYTIEIFGDISLGTQDFPSNVTSVVKLIGRIPELIKNSDEGKGKQLYFYLMPLEILRKFVSSKGQDQGQGELPRSKVKEVTENRAPKQEDEGRDSDSSSELPESETSLQLQVFEEMSLIKQKLGDLYRSVMSNRDILNNTDLLNVETLKNRFNNLGSDFRSNLKRGILDFRSGFEVDKNADRKTRINKLRNIKKEADSDLEQFENTIDNDFKDTRLKIELVDYLRSIFGSGSESESGSESGSQVMWVGRSDSIETSAVKLFRETGSVNKTICSIHFYRIYLKNTILFVNSVLEASNKNLTVLVVDCDFPKESCQLESSHIKTCTVIFEPPTKQQQNDLMPTQTSVIKQSQNLKSPHFAASKIKHGKKSFSKSDKVVVHDFINLITPF